MSIPEGALTVLRLDPGNGLDASPIKSYRYMIYAPIAQMDRASDYEFNLTVFAMCM